MAITLLKNNVPWGPFTRSQIRDGLTRGDFNLQVLAHGPGLTEWLPLGQVLDHFDRGTNLPPVPRGRDLPPVSESMMGKLPPLPPGVHAPKREASPPPGSEFFKREVAHPPALPVTPPAQPAAKSPPPIAKARPPLQPADFFPRFVAFAVDCGVLFVPVLFLLGAGALTILIQGWAEHLDPESKRQEWVLLYGKFEDVLMLVIFGGSWVYGALLESSRWQGTVGKQWVGIKVVDAQGWRISLLHALGRHLAKYFSAMPVFLGFTMAAFSPEGLALHDRMADTRVVKK